MTAYYFHVSLTLDSQHIPHIDSLTPPLFLTHVFLNDCPDQGQSDAGVVRVLVLEFCNQRDLTHFMQQSIKDGKLCMPDDMLADFLFQSCSGLEYLHINDIVHR